MGHEYCGVVVEVGSAVKTIQPGQFVVGSFCLSDNTCPHCAFGFQSSCAQRELMTGAQAPYARVALADGTLVAFSSFESTLVAGDTNGRSDVFVKDMAAGSMTRVSVAAGGVQALGGDSGAASISSDGRFVVFTSAATNLVANDANGVTDVFRFDRQTGAVVRASVDGVSSEQNGPVNDTPAVSSGGVVVVFASAASDLVADDANGAIDVFVREVG